MENNEFNEVKEPVEDVFEAEPIYEVAEKLDWKDAVVGGVAVIAVAGMVYGIVKGIKKLRKAEDDNDIEREAFISKVKSKFGKKHKKDEEETEDEE